MPMTLHNAARPRKVYGNYTDNDTGRLLEQDTIAYIFTNSWE